MHITAGTEADFGHALLKIGGSEIPQYRLTIGRQKIAGTWHITYEHHSAPSTNKRINAEKTQMQTITTVLAFDKEA